jgi:probable HAF family extracellular repeat protein
VQYLRIATLLLFGMLLGGGKAAIADSFSFTTVDFPGPVATFASGINDNGQIVGWIREGIHDPALGYLDTAGSFTSISVPGSAFGTFAYGINDSGQIVGNYGDSTGRNHGFLYNAGSFTTLNYPGAVDTNAYGINDSGQIVGEYDDGNAPVHGFLYDTDGSFTTIDVPAPPSIPTPTGSTTAVRS